MEAASVLNGTCSQCGRAHTIFEHPPGSGSGAESSGLEGAGSSAEEVRRSDRIEVALPAGDGPTCGACGSLLMFRAAAGRGVDATCSGCGLTSSYVPVGSDDAGPRRMRPTRSAGGPDESRGAPLSRARPCRECGGPLRFSTNPDGTISGECSACGNRFTLPPRRDSERGPDSRGPPRFGRRPGPPYGGRGGPRRYGRPPTGRFRRSEGDSDRDGDDRRRRRPRRE